jgi:hypothetical protein
MYDLVIVAGAVSPLADTDAGAGALGLAGAFASAGRRVAVIAQAEVEQATRQAGLARRLRLVAATIGGRPLEVPLFEGRPTSTSAHLYILGSPRVSRGHTAALLASAASTLARDGLFSPSFVIGWGETAAATLSTLVAPFRAFVLPEGVSGPALSADEISALGDTDDTELSRSLIARGVMASNAVVVPSRTSADELTRKPELAGRPSDQPVVVVRLGSDDPPHDPHSDPALPAHYSADKPSGKAECRRTLVRRLSLVAGPRTLVVATPPLDGSRGGQALVDALAQVSGLDVCVVIQPGADRALTERAKILAIQLPGKVAVVPASSPTLARELMGAVDAMVFADPRDLTGRPAALALRYGALPIAPDAGAFGDLLVDYDPVSATGTGMLYAPGDAFELCGALRRALVLRSDSERWPALVSALLRAAPRWSATAALLDSMVPPPALLPTPAEIELTQPAAR